MKTLITTLAVAAMVLVQAVISAAVAQDNAMSSRQQTCVNFTNAVLPHPGAAVTINGFEFRSPAEKGLTIFHLGTRGLQIFRNSEGGLEVTFPRPVKVVSIRFSTRAGRVTLQAQDARGRTLKTQTTSRHPYEKVRVTRDDPSIAKLVLSSETSESGILDVCRR